MQYFDYGKEITRKDAYERALVEAWDIDPQDIVDIFKRAHKEDEDGEDAREQFFALCGVEML